MPSQKTSSRGRTPKASRPLMPGYGLPKGTKGLLPWKWADDRLKKSHNYWIATARPDGKPHLIVIWGLWLEGVFYFSTGRESRKAKNLAMQAYCVIGTEDADQAVAMEGIAEEEPDRAVRRKVLTLYERKYKFDMSSMEEDILNLKEPIYAVRPTVVFGLDEKKFVNSATRWQF